MEKGKNMEREKKGEKRGKGRKNGKGGKKMEMGKEKTERALWRAEFHEESLELRQDIPRKDDPKNGITKSVEIPSPVPDAGSQCPPVSPVFPCSPFLARGKIPKTQPPFSKEF